ncbi:hypothetical protein ED733_007447 [Metarhizium rileyi]|uniref:Uncharacterized protein n=1 Tax=Metarhizium rileyi (strain RCEF 4871) TaxID=1649241 RepID=A0A5C6GF04_METRR|nr:hypothetical protein ED733_007447 [Metarhizium rileyi]
MAGGKCISWRAPHVLRAVFAVVIGRNPCIASSFNHLFLDLDISRQICARIQKPRPTGLKEPSDSVLNFAEYPQPPDKMSSSADASELISTLLKTAEHRIVPLAQKGVASGSKVFGASILSRDTNNERASPLLHGEINS